MRGFTRRILARPLHSVLSLVQLGLSAFAATAALTAFISTTDATAPQERFDLVSTRQGERSALPYGLFEPARLDEISILAPSIAAIAMRYDVDLPTVLIGENVYQFRSGALVSAGYFDLGDIEVVAGTGFTQRELDLGEQVALISEGSAAVLFPNGDALGSEFRLQPQRTPYRVVGLFNRVREPAGPALYMPLGPSTGRLSTLSVLAQPGKAAEAQSQLERAVRNVYAARFAELGLDANQGLQWSVPGQRDTERDSTRLDLVIFSAFSFIVLVVSTVGAFSLLTVNTLDRKREIALRRAMGETRGGVVSSFALEAAATSLLSSLIGASLATVALPLLRPTVYPVISSGALAFDPGSALTVIVILVLLNVALSLIPALQATSARPAHALAEG